MKALGTAGSRASRPVGVLVALAVVAAACSGAPTLLRRPKIIDELVALAPKDAAVTVVHHDEDPFGGFRAHWEWTFTPDDPRAAIDAYRTWLTSRGVTLIKGPVSECDPAWCVSFGSSGFGLTVTVPKVIVAKETVIDGETVGRDTFVIGTDVLGTVDDGLIGPDGELIR